MRLLAFAIVAVVGTVALPSDLWGGLKVGIGPASSVKRPEALSHEELTAQQMHAALFTEDQFPTARTCAGCHPQHYREWSVSPHAYAQLSPVFNAMHGTIVKLTNGTFGDFCIRCHTQVGMQKNEPVFESNLYRHPSSREGITCIVCHRVRADFGKVSGRFNLERGDIFGPVYGPSGNDELKRVVLDEQDEYRLDLVTKKSELPAGEENRAVHAKVEPGFFQTQPGFCGSCHDVTLGNGFRLEEAFSEYKSSPAEGEATCQDCHMGTVQGVKSDYRMAPAATVGGRNTKPRKRTDHMFPGPDYSIVHPGIFPHLPDVDLKFANLGDWLAFEHEEGWGTETFESSDRARELDAHPIWSEPDRRREARGILDRQFRLLDDYKSAQLEVLRAGYKLGDIVIERADNKQLKFKIQVRNGTDGHNIPTGFIAERTLFLEVTVTDRDGTVLFVSGDTDPNGDVRDAHSLYVHNGELKLDKHLFSLQSKFVTRNVRGGEREQVLAVNFSPDPLPFLRPSTLSTIIHGRPRGARIHRVGIKPNGVRWPEYKVKRKALTGKTPYQIRVRMIAGMVPPNLIHEIKDVGFDFGMTPREVADRVVAGRQILYDKQVVVDGRGAAQSAAAHRDRSESQNDSVKDERAHVQ